MTTTMQLSGFAEADSILSQLPLLLRGKYLEKSLLEAMAIINQASAEHAPAAGKSVGGIPYTEKRRGFRASRKRLAKSISSVLRRYNDGEVIAAVGGPVKKHAGRISHLVEFGFNHTTGGTFAGSGGRTRIAKKHTKATQNWALKRGRRVELSEPMTVWTSTVNAKRTGAGKRGAVIPGRSFVGAAWNRHRNEVQSLVADALRRFAEELKHKKNNAT